MNVEVDDGLSPDPENPGWVRGWGVVQGAPWKLKGVYATQEKAESKAEGEMRVQWGAHRLGSDDFVYID